MFSRVSCAKAASESTAYDVFIFPKQWKYKIVDRAGQMIKARAQYRAIRSLGSEISQITVVKGSFFGAWVSKVAYYSAYVIGESV
jgi:hypothetical protein